MIKSIFKYSLWIILAVIVGALVVGLRNCGNPPRQMAGVVTPLDSNYLPVRVEQYRPPSLPFEHANPPVKRLPVGVREKDVRRVVTIAKISGPLQLVETNDGMIYLPKDSSTSSITVTNYLPPVFEFSPEIFGGISLGLGGESFSVLPSAGISVFNMCGSLHVPVIAVNPYGLGVGAGVQVIGNYYVGFSRDLWNWTLEPLENRLTVYYSF